MTRQKTLRTHLARAAVRAVVGTALVFGSVWLAGVASHSEAAHGGFTAELAPGSPAAVLEAHGCWSGPGPVGVTARHAVVRTSQSGPVRYVGGALFTQAVDQAVLNHGHGLIVYGFCR